MIGHRFRSPVVMALVMVGCAVPVVVGESLLQKVFAPGVAPVASVFGLACGLCLGWRLWGRRPATTQAVSRGGEMDHAPSRLYRAAIELAGLSAEREAAPPCDANAIVLPFPRPNTPPANLERAIEDLSAFPIFSEIMKSQMSGVTELSDQAAMSLLSNLNGVDTTIRALLKFIDHSGSNDKVAQIISQIEEQMAGCRQLLENFADRQAEDARLTLGQLAKISMDTNGVLNAIKGVQGIARQTTMLSVNVSIEAARAGEAGRGFSVIGTEIRSLATRVQGLANEVHQRVDSLMRAVTVDLEQQARLREQTQREAIANIAATLTALTDNLLTIVTYNRDVMHKVETEGEAIGGPILDMMAGIQFQDIIRQQLDQLTHMAAMVDDHMRWLSAALADQAEDLPADTLLQKLDAQFGGYVMAAQRRSHRAARGDAAPQEEVARIELF